MSFQQFLVSPWLTAIRVAATANVAGTYNNGPNNNGVGATLTVAASSLTVDSVVVVVGDRILLPSQTAANQCGIYVVNSIGSTVVLQRSEDQQNIEQLRAGQYISVGAGTVNAGAAFVLVEPLPAHFGIDNLVFASAVAAGLGTMSTQNANAVAITGGTITGITDLAVADGGTGASTGPLALTGLGVKRATTAVYGGGGTSNAFVATGLAATDIVVATILTSGVAASAVAKAVPTANTLTVTFTVDPGAGTTVSWHALPA